MFSRQITMFASFHQPLCFFEGSVLIFFTQKYSSNISMNVGKNTKYDITKTNIDHMQVLI